LGGKGIADPCGYCTAPRAGALYPQEIHAVPLEGVYYYHPSQHAINLHVEGDLRPELSAVALHQDAVQEAPMTMIMAAVYARTSRKYGSNRSPRYVHMEAGHAAQNVLLEAVSLRLGAVPIGAFEDRRVQSLLHLPKEHEPLYLISIGYPR
jgi:SagB-type dehydrogenase family enzyme